MNIHLGYEIGTGKEVSVPLAHTAVTGQTQSSGKTTTLEALIQRSKCRAIAFITKRGEGTFQSNTTVQPYFSEAVDWVLVKELLEAQAKTKLKFETSWIIEVSKGAETLADVKRNVEMALRGVWNNSLGKKGKEWTRKPATGLSQGVYTVLDAYLEILLPQIAALNYQKTLKLNPGLNVMDLTPYSLEMQGLVVRSVLQWVYEKEKNVIVVIPEAWELLPEQKGSPVRAAAETFIRKGAVLGNYLFLDSQDLAGVNKAILRSVGVWILGVQREANEVARTLKQFISKPARPKPDDLMSLGKGQFYVAYGITQSTCYVQPYWMNNLHAQAIATGDEPIESAAAVHRQYLKQFKASERVQPVPEQEAAPPSEAAGPAGTAASPNDSPQGGRGTAEDPLLGARVGPAVPPSIEFPPKGRPFASEYGRQESGADNAQKSREAKTMAMPNLKEAVEDAAELYNYFRARMLNDPQVLAVLRERPEIRLTEQPKVLEVDGETLTGQIASLIEEGFFSTPKNGNQVFIEIVDRRRKAFAKTTVYDTLDQVAGLGFLVRDSRKCYSMTGAKVTRIRAMGGR